MNDEQRSHKRSLFDGLTAAAAWAGVVVASWTAYEQYRLGQIRPQLAYGQCVAKYAVEGEADCYIHSRCWVTNQGDGGARDVRVIIWNIPESADIRCSMAHVIERRTADTALVRIDTIPPRSNASVVVLPFKDPGAKNFGPFVEKVYNADAYAKEEEWLRTSAKHEIFEVLAKTDQFESGVYGTYNCWDTPVHEEDLDIGRMMFTVYDK